MLDKLSDPEGDDYEIVLGNHHFYKLVLQVESNGVDDSHLRLKQNGKEMILSRSKWSKVCNRVHESRYVFTPFELCELYGASIQLTRRVLGDLHLSSLVIDHYLNDPTVHRRHGQEKWNFLPEMSDPSSSERLEHRLIPRFSDERIILQLNALILHQSDIYLNNRNCRGCKSNSNVQADHRHYYHDDLAEWKSGLSRHITLANSNHLLQHALSKLNDATGWKIENTLEKIQETPQNFASDFRSCKDSYFDQERIALYNRLFIHLKLVDI